MKKLKSNRTSIGGYGRCWYSMQGDRSKYLSLMTYVGYSFTYSNHGLRRSSYKFHRGIVKRNGCFEAKINVRSFVGF